MELGVNHPLTISLNERYLSVLESMAHMEGRQPEELAKEYLEFYIKDYIEVQLEAIGQDSNHGALLLKSWLDTLEGKE
jgi:hypothetical protein